MTKNKLCCRIFPVVLVLIATLISSGIWYFDEGNHGITFLKDREELFNFLGTVLFITVIPIGLFYYFNDKDRYQDKARQLALLGFLPALAYWVFLML